MSACLSLLPIGHWSLVIGHWSFRRTRPGVMNRSHNEVPGRRAGDEGGSRRDDVHDSPRGPEVARASPSSADAARRGARGTAAAHRPRDADPAAQPGGGRAGADGRTGAPRAQAPGAGPGAELPLGVALGGLAARRGELLRGPRAAAQAEHAAGSRSSSPDRRGGGDGAPARAQAAAPLGPRPREGRRVRAVGNRPRLPGAEAALRRAGSHQRGAARRVARPPDSGPRPARAFRRAVLAGPGEIRPRRAQRRRLRARHRSRRLARGPDARRVEMPLRAVAGGAR